MTDDANGANPDDDVFVYTTGSIVPRDVVRARVHPSVTVIPENAFMKCRQLEEVELPDGLQTIGRSAFYRCQRLKRIQIPSTVTAISEMAFQLCKKLEEVELSEGLQTIRKDAFRSCKVLKRIKIPSTVTIIGDFAFCLCRRLKEVELSEELQTIGKSAFNFCQSLKHISFPSTIRSIGAAAFTETTSLLNINLPDGIERIGSYAFYQGGLLTLRIPPLITTIPEEMVEHAQSLFSVELSESVTHVESYAFTRCFSLRNLAIPPNADVENDDSVFSDCTDLEQLFSSDFSLDSDEQIVNALKHRFDNLPIHKMLYYQSYEPVRAEQLNDESKLDPTGKQQDCLGMTPLHILACSTVQDLALYKVLIEKYPENLITEDRWGALPLLYAVWGDTPSVIVQYLVGMYKSIYPEYELNWTKMVETLGLATVPKGVIQKVVDLQKEYFPKQIMDWERLLESLLNTHHTWNLPSIGNETFGYFVQFSLAKRIDAIGPKQWRDAIKHTTENDFVGPRRNFITKVKTELAQYETEYHNLKEATSIVELALWKHKMNDHILGERERRRKKTKIEDSSIREQCRISCGADVVIQHMLPYLLPKPEVHADKIQHNSTIDSSSESDDESDISHF